MSQHTDATKISRGNWAVVRHGGGEPTRPHLRGKPFGLYLTGGDGDLKGEDFLTKEEALELRDYINKHLGVPRD